MFRFLQHKAVGVLCAGLWAALVAGVAIPCSTFVLRDGETVVFGKNYDWNVSEGLIFANQRGVARGSILDGSDRPAQWVSRFGSVTFNQYGRDFPNGGINAAGLVVELMWLEGSRYPEVDGRSALGVLEWIQYQLDTSSNVAEVIASDADVRVFGRTALHYLVADRAGNAATIEFLDGKRVAHTGESLPIPVLTNSPYDSALKAFERSLGEPLPTTRGSLDRFRIAGQRLAEFDETHSPETDPIRYAFETLDRVSQGADTRWSIVYELDRDVTRVHFVTRNNREAKSIDLSRLDFACSGRPDWIDLHLDGSGDVTDRFEPYDAARNVALIRAAYRKTSFLSDTPRHEVRAVAEHPAASRCEP